MAPGRASRAERVCVRCAGVEQPLQLGTPSPRSHAAGTIVLPCARRLASTSSRVVYSNQLAPRLLVCPAALGTAFPSCAWAARRECFPCGPEVLSGSWAAGLGPLPQSAGPHSRRDAGRVCRVMQAALAGRCWQCLGGDAGHAHGAMLATFARRRRWCLPGSRVLSLETHQKVPPQHAQPCLLLLLTRRDLL